jgi:hypothetical protein
LPVATTDSPESAATYPWPTPPPAVRRVLSGISGVGCSGWVSGTLEAEPVNNRHKRRAELARFRRETGGALLTCLVDANDPAMREVPP